MKSHGGDEKNEMVSGREGYTYTPQNIIIRFLTNHVAFLAPFENLLVI